MDTTRRDLLQLGAASVAAAALSPSATAATARKPEPVARQQLSLQPQPWGYFNDQPLVSATKMEFEQMKPTRMYGGAAFEGIPVWGGFSNKKGERYYIQTRFIRPTDTTLTPMMSNRGGQDRLTPLEEFEKAFNGHVLTKWTSDSFAAVGLGGRGQPFSFRMNAKGSEWREGDLLSLDGRIVGGCGLSFFTPMPTGGAVMHVWHTQRASGTILGEEVEGFYDASWMYITPGSNYAAAYAAKERSWVSFGNEYDDGTIEVGQVIYGTGDWRCALMANQDGPFLLTTVLSAKGDFRPDHYPRSIAFNINGEDWIWTPGQNCAIDYGKLMSGMTAPPKDMLDALPLPIANMMVHKQMEGTFVRAGETRKLRAHYAINATEPF